MGIIILESVLRSCYKVIFHVEHLTQCLGHNKYLIYVNYNDYCLISLGNLGIKLSRLLCYRTSQSLYYNIKNWHFPGRRRWEAAFSKVFGQLISLTRSFFQTGYLVNSQLIRCKLVPENTVQEALSDTACFCLVGLSWK